MDEIGFEYRKAKKKFDDIVIKLEAAKQNLSRQALVLKETYGIDEAQIDKTIETVSDKIEVLNKKRQTLLDEINTIINKVNLYGK